MYSHEDKTSYPFRYSPEVISFFNGLHDNGVNVHWLTSWGNDAANQVAPALGFHEFPVAGVKPVDGTGLRCWMFDWWKWAVIRDFTSKPENRNSRVVWVDNDISKTVKNYFKTLSTPKVLTVAPFGTVGLRKDDVKRIEWFLNEDDNT